MHSSDFSARHAAFRSLHESGCFILPNPWDKGSARYLESVGFKALATTSAGFAFSRAVPDRKLHVDAVITHCRDIVAASSLPINVDFEDGYATTIDALKDHVAACAKTGISALSIEDAKPEPGTLFDFDEAVTRMRAAREAIDAVDPAIMLVGRAEHFLIGKPDLDEVIKRLCAYAEVGADCLYAPGLSNADDIKAIVDAVAPKPVNVMMGPAAPLGFDTLAKLGVRRISTGSSLAMAAWTGFVNATDKLLQQDISGSDEAVSYPQLCQLFQQA